MVIQYIIELKNIETIYDNKSFIGYYAINDSRDERNNNGYSTELEEIDYNIQKNNDTIEKCNSSMKCLNYAVNVRKEYFTVYIEMLGEMNPRKKYWLNQDLMTLYREYMSNFIIVYEYLGFTSTEPNLADWEYELTCRLTFTEMENDMLISMRYDMADDF